MLNVPKTRNEVHINIETLTNLSPQCPLLKNGASWNSFPSVLREPFCGLATCTALKVRIMKLKRCLIDNEMVEKIKTKRKRLCDVRHFTKEGTGRILRLNLPNFFYAPPLDLFEH